VEPVRGKQNAARFDALRQRSDHGCELIHAMNEWTTQQTITENDVIGLFPMGGLASDVVLKEDYSLCSSTGDERPDQSAKQTLSFRGVGKKSVGSREQFKRFEGASVYQTVFSIYAACLEENGQIIGAFTRPAGGIKAAKLSEMAIPVLLDPFFQKPDLCRVAAKAAAVVTGEKECEEKADAIALIRGKHLQQSAGVDYGRCLAKPLQGVKPGCRFVKEGVSRFRRIAERQGKEPSECAGNFLHGQVEFGYGAHLTGYGKSCIPETEGIAGGVGPKTLPEPDHIPFQFMVFNAAEDHQAGEVFSGLLGG
jgi:hypothetical protein